MHATTTQEFYVVTALINMALWLRFWSSGYAYSLSCPVVTRPSWLPAPFVLALRQKVLYLTLCRGSPFVMLAAAVWPVWPLRLITAAWHSLYALAESSCTHSHRDFAAIYCTWALALLSTNLAHGVSLGVCIVFVASSGLAKLHVAGVAEWAAPGTLRSILEEYGKLGFVEFGPLLPWANRLLCRHDWLVGGLSAFTLLFECVLVPSALLLPMTLRPLLTIASGSLHLGIAAVQSFDIGIFFLPNLGTYLLGFGAAVPLLSPGWWCAVLVCAVSLSPVVLNGRLVPEDWPLTPFALFAFSDMQWNALFDRLVRARTRLVLSTCHKSPVGCLVLPKLGLTHEVPPCEHFVYDGWEQVIGETLVFETVLDGCAFSQMAVEGAPEGWAPRLVNAVEEWLGHERLVVALTGAPLKYAFVVRIDEAQRVCEVLADGKTTLKEHRS